MRPAILRPQAEVDLLDATRWYLTQGGESLAARFFDSARAAYAVIERQPAIGSPRLGLLAGVDGLRSWPVTSFPHRWCYFERHDHLDVVRLLGERQDVAAILADLRD